MPRFFLENISGKTVELEGEDARHMIKSLRMKIGDIVTISDGEQMEYGCEIQAIHDGKVELQVLYSQPTQMEPTVEVTLYQGLPKGEKMDDLIQKSVELGVGRIVPVLTQRSVSRPDGKSARKKQERWQKIALEAAKQCGRGKIPPVEAVVPFEKAVSECTSSRKILFYEGGGKPLRMLFKAGQKVDSIAVFIGPEGGFAPEEVEQIARAGGECATLGKRILRTQTAPVAVLACMMLLTGNLE